jgi:prepilin-type N-terminal cleavage/methylation domain-containing protein
MSKPIHNPSGPSPTTGFTLLELMVAMALSLLLFGLALTLVQQLGNTADIVGSMSDVNENLRAAVNMVSRDLSTAGENIPLGGIPVPSGGSATAITRPGPGALTFPATGYIPVLTPGYTLGPPQGSGANAITTDIVTIIGVNQTSLFNQTAVTGSPTVSSSQAQITVSTTAAGYVSLGQLIMLTNINGYCLLAVSSVTTTTGVITFKNGDSNDVLGVNQFPTLSGSGTITSGPTSGTILQLETPTTSWGKTTYAWPTTLTAYPISMVTYYLDTSTPRRLMKLVTVGTAQAQPVALGINVMTLQYSLSPLATPTDPTSNPASPNSIRKVVLTMIGETDHQNHANGQWYSKEIRNAVTVQNLDYYNKYSLGAKMTQN